MSLTDLTSQQPPSEIDRKRRAGVRRTALALGAVALAIYIAFVLSGVIGRV